MNGDNDVFAVKKELRSQMRRREAEFLASGASASESERILSELEASPEFAAARTVLAYMSIPGEVETAEFIARWAGAPQGAAPCRRIVIPKVCGDELELFEYSPVHLVPGYRGIMEPSETAVPVSPEEIDLAIVPGVAFARISAGGADAAGHAGSVLRLGRGRGYYDRLLPRLRCPVVGLCFPFRVVPSLPLDPWDRPLDGLFF